jgi:hypothetical protein
MKTFLLDEPAFGCTHARVVEVVDDAQGKRLVTKWQRGVLDGNGDFVPCDDMEDEVQDLPPYQHPMDKTGNTLVARSVAYSDLKATVNLNDHEAAFDRMVEAGKVPAGSMLAAEEPK